MLLRLGTQQRGRSQAHKQIPPGARPGQKAGKAVAIVHTGLTSPTSSQSCKVTCARQMASSCRAQAESVSASTVEGDGLPSVSVLGIGLMGNKMARRLQSLGYKTTVWNRDSSKAQPLAEAGCSVAESAVEAVGASDVVLLVLSDAAAIRSTLLEDPKTTAALPGKHVLQMGTIGPAESISIAADVEASGAQYMEAPVLGSQPEAEQGTLLVMVGSKEAPDGTPPGSVLKAFCSEANYIGEVGTAAAVKLALNQLIASLTVGFSTSLALLQKSNVDVDKFMAILRPSALYAPTFDKKLQRMLDREYSNPNFPTKHLLKDVKLFQKEAEGAKINSALLKGLDKVIDSAVARGLHFTDYSAVHEAVSFPEGSEDA